MESKQPDYNYLDSLNDQQRAAVVYKDGPSLVIAGAGSGKTRVLTYKIVDLLRNGFMPYRILALTFTNKAAREMKERIAALTGEKIASRLWMGTFHSIFLRILRSHADKIGFKSGFTIYDSTDSRSLIKSLVKEYGLDDKSYKPSTLASVFSNAKNAMIAPEQYLLDRDLTDVDKRAKRPMTGRLYQLYCQRLHTANAMDFDDILYYMNILLRDNPDIRRHYQEFFQYILVDEYQDTNFAQHLVISQLSNERNLLCVVGDDAQSIYSFRGANIGNIINLERKYPGLKIFKLERNYRSTQNIVNAAGSLIEKNTRQLKKEVFSENERGSLIEVVKTFSDMEEAYMVANLLSQSKLTHHDAFDEYAILYRTNAQSRVLEEALRKRNIPYRIYGGLSFYQRKEIKDAICYFRLTINPDDDEALRRIINYPSRGIGDTTLMKIQTAANANGVSMWRVIENPGQYALNVNSGTLRKLNSFREMMVEFITDNEKSDAYRLAQLIYNRTGILVSLAHDNTPETISKQENLQELLAGLKEFVDGRIESGIEDLSMQGFLSEVMLATDQDETDDSPEPKVTLMTAHAAKGLEFKHIFIVGVEEDLFPSSMSMDSMDQIEEERRLLYVAITRAKETCTLSYANSRFRNGQTTLTRPSRFLGDINRKYLKMVNSADIPGDDQFINPTSNYGRHPYGPNRSGTPGNHSNIYSSSAQVANSIRTFKSSALPPRQQATTQDDRYSLHKAAELHVGSVIEHQKFGRGTVSALSKVSGEDAITVDFGILGTKKLLLKFARFAINP